MQETQQHDEGDAHAPRCAAAVDPGPSFRGGHGLASQLAGSMVQKPALSERYGMHHKSRGVAVIINNRNFSPTLRLDQRSGTDDDAAKLYQCFGHLNFTNIKPFKDLKCADIKQRLNEVASMNHNDHDMFVCAILSHGELGKIYGTDGPISVQDVVDIVKKGNDRGLKGKPKLLIIQACRGDRLDSGAIVTDMAGPGPVLRSSYSVPVEPDFLIVYSSTPGFYSWRNSKNGSHFIRVLTEELIERSFSSELLRILTRVNRRVACEFSSNTLDESTRDKKQIPCVTSMLTKELYFSKK